MSARPIGEIVAPIIARICAAADFQRILDRCPTAADRKGLIIAAHSHGALDDEECGLLITANMLEAA